MKDLEGRVAVVAGATRGAGRSTTHADIKILKLD